MRGPVAILFTSFLLTGCFQTRADIQQEKEQQAMESSMQQSVAEQSQSLEELQQHVAKLQGHIEELEHGHKSDAGAEQKNQEELNKKLAAITARLDAIEQKQEVLFTEVTKAKQEALQAPKSAPAELAQGGTPKRKAAGFEAGITAFHAHQYADAAANFSAYLKSGKSVKHALDANYFLGESQYQLKQYSQAILAYNAVHEKAGKALLGRKATLRIAECFSLMGNHKDAKAFAQLLLDASPDSAEARAARKYLK